MVHDILKNITYTIYCSSGLGRNSNISCAKYNVTTIVTWIQTWLSLSSTQQLSKYGISPQANGSRCSGHHKLFSHHEAFIGYMKSYTKEIMNHLMVSYGRIIATDIEMKKNHRTHHHQYISSSRSLMMKYSMKARKTHHTHLHKYYKWHITQ